MNRPPCRSATTCASGPNGITCRALLALGEGEGGARRRGRPAPRRPRTRRPQNADGSPAVGGEGAGREGGAPRPRRERPPRPPKPEGDRAPRTPSATTLFVANLPFSVDSTGLAEIFAGLNLKSAHVVLKRNNRSKGFGFVEFNNADDQAKALIAVDKKTVDNRELIVKVALTEPAGEHKEGGERAAPAPAAGAAPNAGAAAGSPAQPKKDAAAGSPAVPKKDAAAGSPAVPKKDAAAPASPAAVGSPKPN